jgi:hypothetical protein
MRNAEARFRDYMKGRSGSFFSCLFQAAFRADAANLQKLAKGFPEEIACVVAYQQGTLKIEEEYGE